MQRDDLLAEEYECLLTLWELEDKIELVEKESSVELFYKQGLLDEMEETWDSMNSRQKICLAILVGLHFGIPIMQEDLALMKMNSFNIPANELNLGPDEPCEMASSQSDLDRFNLGGSSLAVFNGE